MYSESYLLYVIVGIGILAAFITMVFKLIKIHNILAFFMDIELRKPENWYNINCEKCTKEIPVSRAMKNTVNCPHCGNINRISN